MKKLLLMCALFLSAVSFSNAQGQGGAGGFGGQQMAPEDRAKALVDNQRFATIALTADQKTKATPILVNLYKAQTAMMTGAADPRAAATDPKYVALGADAEKALVALLTADQKKAYDALLATAKEANPAATAVFTGRGGGGRGQGGGQGAGGGGGAPRPAGQ